MAEVQSHPQKWEQVALHPSHKCSSGSDDVLNIAKCDCNIFEWLKTSGYKLAYDSYLQVPAIGQREPAMCFIHDRLLYLTQSGVFYCLAQNLKTKQSFVQWANNNQTSE